MKRLCAGMLALAAETGAFGEYRALAQGPDDSQMVRSIGRSAARLHEIASRFIAKEKTTIRRKLENSAWYVQDVECGMRYVQRDDGIHERRSNCSTNADRGVNDLSQLILLFAPAMLGRYSFERAGTAYDVGPLGAAYFRYEQRDGPEALSVRNGKKVERQPIHGVVWVATDGSVVYRVSLDTDRPGGLRDHAEVTYAIDIDGGVVPTSAAWRQFRNEDLIAETTSQYTRTDTRQ